MTTYKIGDRVEVIQAPNTAGTVLGIHKRGTMAVKFDNGVTNHDVHTFAIRPCTPTPSVIIIDRNDLPEVVLLDENWMQVNRRSFSTSGTHGEHRSYAREHLAIAEFLEAREAQAAEDAAAEKLGEQLMQQRRDDIADFYVGCEYRHAPKSAKQLIDHIIDLQDQLDAAKC